MTQEQNCADPPLFDVPEILPLRRVIPLPKRRRTAIDSSADKTPERAGTPTPDELASTLSTSMALQSQSQSQRPPHYVPLFKDTTTAPTPPPAPRRGPRGPGPRLAMKMIKDDIDSRHVNPEDIVSREGLAQMYAFASRAERDDGDRDDSEYTDHLRQPGNNKKRKVPVTAAGAPSNDVSCVSIDSDEYTERTIRELEERSAAMEALQALAIPAPPAPISLGQRTRLTRAAHAALLHKEIIKSRKQQLAIFLGTLSQDDSLALDAALYDYPLSKETEMQKGYKPPIRLSRRPERRKQRAECLVLKELPANQVDANVKVPESSFTFEYDSPTSERMRALRDEVTFLQDRIKSEWSRQIKMAEVARRAHRTVKDMQKELKKQEQRVKLAERLMSEMPWSDIEKVTPKSKGKKKKRSTLANASNPHHLRNYVPSRLPNANANRSSSMLAAGNDPYSMFAMRFLSAQLPPRKQQHTPGVTPTASLTNPEEEWICPSCEYNLFYGDDHSYRRAVRQRKKILSRRRRAQERAAATAAGRKKSVSASAVPPGDDEAEGDDLVDEVEPGAAEHGTENAKRGKPAMKVEQDRDRDKSIQS